MTAALTDRQRMCLDYIISCVHKRALPPTLREIAGHMGSSWTNAAVCHLDALTSKGYIRINGHLSSRAITVLRQPDGERFAVVRAVANLAGDDLPASITVGGEVLQRVPFGMNRESP